ncbi:hypothetical protein JCM11251_003720 [Rhodosporidiobolus azoricus]
MLYTSPYPQVELPERSVWEHVWQNPTKRDDGHPAVIDGPTGRIMSRGELRTLARQVANGYRTVADLSPGDVVCIFSPNSFYYYGLVLATQCAGLVFSGANAAYTPNELSHQLEDSGAKLLLVHPSLLDVALSATSSLGWSSQQQKQRIVYAVRQDEAESAKADFRCLDSLISTELFTPHAVEEPRTTIAFLGYSSGTSGKAKGVQTSHYNMTSVLSILGALETGPNDVQLAVLPLNHESSRSSFSIPRLSLSSGPLWHQVLTAGSPMSTHIYALTKILLLSVLRAIPVIILPKFTLPALCSLIERYRITICMLVPPIALQLVKTDEADQYDLSSLRLIISGAAPLGPELEERLAVKFPKCEVVQAYGLTETSPTTHIAIKPKRGSIGPLLPVLKARIIDPESGKDVKRGEQGEMWLSGPTIMLGYHRRPEATAETLVSHPSDPGIVWLRTGDIAYVDEEGYFFIADRLKELIKVKGFQVPPAELEATVLENPSVLDCAVIGVYKEDEATEYPRAYVVLTEEGKKQADPVTAIHSWTKEKVAHYKQLKGGIKVVDAIPKSPSGKILRRVLRDQAKQETEQEAKAKKARKDGAAQQAKL